jgi:hypothetical protein
MRTLFNRLYSDYVMPSRLTMHEQFIRSARDAGYRQTSVRGFLESMRAGQPPNDPVVIHRHDIDTDVRTARKLFELEKRHGIRSSYYFRLSTMDFGLMREIEEYGSEASYHYEELASFAKKNKITNPAAIPARLPEIKQKFEQNFRWVEQRLGKKMTTVASHGDFANRRLKVNNTILIDPELRERCGIECETYDQTLMENVEIYISDRAYPQYYHPISPMHALGRHQRIYLLTHPRQVETNWRENTKDNLFRFYEGLTW